MSLRNGLCLKYDNMKSFESLVIIKIISFTINEKQQKIKPFC